MHGFQQKLFSAKCCLSLFQRKGPSQPLEVVFFFCSAGGGGGSMLTYHHAFYLIAWSSFIFCFGAVFFFLGRREK
jgi:hypothetical protein